MNVLGIIFDWQLCVVGLLVVACLVWTGRRIWLVSGSYKKNISPCDTCASGCALKDLYRKNGLVCNAKQDMGKKVIPNNLENKNKVVPLHSQSGNNGS